MKKLILTFITICLCLVTSFSQSNYFPLEDGNYWVFEGSGEYDSIYIASSDTMINNNEVFYWIEYFESDTDSFFDTSYVYYENNFVMYFFDNEPPSQMVQINPVDGASWYSSLYGDTLTTNATGSQSVPFGDFENTYSISNANLGFELFFAPDFGPIRSSFDIDLVLVRSNLQIVAGTVTFNSKHPFQLNIHPNPVTDYLQIDLDQEIVYIALMNSKGEIVDEFQSTKKIDMEPYPSGVYTLRVHDGQSMYHGKLVKE